MRIISATRPMGVTALILLLGATAARSQFVPLFGNQAPLLNGADFDLANAAARKLLEPQPAAIGPIANWADPALGNRGTLTMGRTCRVSGVWKLM